MLCLYPKTTALEYDFAWSLTSEGSLLQPFPSGTPISEARIVPGNPCLPFSSN